MIVGFDVGGTNVRAVGLRRGSVEPLAIRRGKTIADGDGLVATVVELTEALADDVGEAVDAVGLGVAALLDSDGVFRYAPNIAGVLDYPLVARVSDKLGVPVVAENDATAATWGESRFGAGVGYDHMVFVALGTGIGTGMVLNGRLYRGAHGYAGEAGHVTIDKGGSTSRRGPGWVVSPGPALPPESWMSWCTMPGRSRRSPGNT